MAVPYQYQRSFVSIDELPQSRVVINEKSLDSWQTGSSMLLGLYDSWHAHERYTSGIKKPKTKVDKKVKQLVLKQANLIKRSGCHGIVCSAQEAKIVRKKYKKLLIITPGIRMPGDSSNDQMRTMTPKDAFENKVSGIVIGRSLTKGNIKNNTKRLLDHLNK